METANAGLSSQQAPLTPNQQAPKAAPSADPAQQSQILPETPAPKVDQDKDLEWVTRFNTLSKKEKALLNQKKSLEEQRKQISEFNELKRLARENPSDLLEKLGVTYDDITNYYLNDGKVTEDQKYKILESKLEALNKEREDEKKAIEEQREAELINSFKQKIKETAKTDEKYELVNAYGEDGVDLVYQIADQWHAKTGEIDMARAMSLAEDYIETDLVNKIKSSKKLRELVFGTQNPQEVNKAEAPEDIGHREPNPISTLTHKATTSSIAPDKPRMLSDDESKRRSAEMIAQSWAQKAAQ